MGNEYRYINKDFSRLTDYEKTRIKVGVKKNNQEIVDIERIYFSIYHEDLNVLEIGKKATFASIVEDYADDGNETSKVLVMEFGLAEDTIANAKISKSILSKGLSEIINILEEGLRKIKEEYELFVC